MKSPVLSQKEIAEKLGISTATVSLVIRNPDTNRASAKTKKRIFEHAAPARRQPRMTNTRTDTLIFVMSRDTSRFFYQQSLLQGAQEQAAKLGMKLEVVNPEQELQGRQAEPHVQGVLLESPDLVSDPIGRISEHFRTITLNAYYQEEPLGIGVLSDPFGGFRQALQHVLELGHQRIGFLGYDSPNSAGFVRYSERLGAFTEACRALGISLNDEAIRMIPNPDNERIDRSPEISNVLRMWQASPSAPTAVLCFNDLLAARVTMLAREMGLQIPESMSLIGYDNESVCDVVTPQLTSISPQFAQMGRLGVSMLMNDQMWDTDDMPYRIVVPASLQVRTSTAPLGVTNS